MHMNSEWQEKKTQDSQKTIHTWDTPAEVLRPEERLDCHLLSLAGVKLTELITILGCMDDPFFRPANKHSVKISCYGAQSPPWWKKLYKWKLRSTSSNLKKKKKRQKKCWEDKYWYLHCNYWYIRAFWAKVQRSLSTRFRERSNNFIHSPTQNNGELIGSVLRAELSDITECASRA